MRTVVITGAARGLGLASAAHLYNQGWRVVGAMRSVEAGLDKMRKALGAKVDDPRLVGLKLDLMDLASIPATGQAILDAVGAPDAVVHNAGIAAFGGAEEMPEDVWQQVFSTNLFGPVALTKALLPAMRARGRGRIVVISSAGAIRGMPGISAYSASKGAIERWGEALSQEIAPFGLGVSILVTGTFDTEILEKTADYGNQSGPYGSIYEAIHVNGKAMVSKPASPSLFAKALGEILLEEAPITKRTVGSDATSLAVMARLLPGGWVHKIIRSAMKIPARGSLASTNNAIAHAPAAPGQAAPARAVLPKIDFRDQVVIVTGAGRGLGRLYALEFARRGAAVVVNDLGSTMSGDGADASVADQVVAEILAFGGRAVASYHSVATAEGGDAIVQTAIKQFGRLDAVVANAGIFGTVDFEQISTEEWRRMLNVHLDGSFYLSQPAYRVMKQQGYGRFVFTSSAVGMFGQPLAVHYGAAKSGVVGLSNGLAVEGEDHGIKSNCVLPYGSSRMVTHGAGGSEAEAQTPFLQILDPKLVVPIVVFLASRSCELTHHNYSAAAGLYARVFTGLGKGWLSPQGHEPSADDIAHNINQVSATQPFIVPMSTVDEVMQISMRRGLMQDPPTASSSSGFTADSKLGDLLDHPQARAVMVSHYPEMAKAGPLLRMGRKYTLRQISSFPQAKMPPERLQSIVDELQKL